VSVRHLLVVPFFKEMRNQLHSLPILLDLTFVVVVLGPQVLFQDHYDPFGQCVEIHLRKLVWKINNVFLRLLIEFEFQGRGEGLLV